MIWRLVQFCHGVLLLSLLTSCAQTNQLAFYQLSQAELNQQIQAQLSAVPQQLRLAGFQLSVEQFQLQSTIAPAGQPWVQLQMQLAVKADLALIKLPLQFALTLQARPTFIQAQQAVFLTDLKLTSASMQGAGQTARLQPLSAEVQHWLAQWLKQHPVYRLDPTKFSHKLLLNIPLQIQLQPGLLTLSPAYGA